MVLPIDVWRELPAAAEFVLVRRPGATRLEVRIEGAVAADAPDRIAARCRTPVDVVSVEAGSLPRAAYKQERVIEEPAHEPSRS
jgi:hypothetical protein